MHVDVEARCDFPWILGKTTSRLWVSVMYDRIPPDSLICCWRWISLKTLSRVRSRGDLYGWMGANEASGFGLISFLNRNTIDPSRLASRSCSTVLRLPKAVIGSAMRLGRGTNGTFSHGTSRLYGKYNRRETRLENLFMSLMKIFALSKLAHMSHVCVDRVLF